MLKREILYFGDRYILFCDGKCDKAWGNNTRPQVLLSDNPDDYEFLADDELGEAPLNPGTYEGGIGRPESVGRLTKWCARECERSRKVPVDVTVFELRDFSHRLRNMLFASDNQALRTGGVSVGLGS